MTNELAEDPFVGVARLAEIFDVKALTIRRWLNGGKLRGVRINGHWKVRESEVNRFVEELYGE